MIFEIGGKDFHFNWNRNRENAPYIYFEGKLYYSITMNVYSGKEVKLCDPEYVDLRPNLNILIPQKVTIKEYNYLKKQNV